MADIAERIRIKFQLTAARRRLARRARPARSRWRVSTHSRPKAAGGRIWSYNCNSNCFNSQPPEGGWLLLVFRLVSLRRFNSQPPEGGWWPSCVSTGTTKPFQLTAARRRLEMDDTIGAVLLGFNSQPPEGGWILGIVGAHEPASFNSQPPEGGWEH